MQSVLAYILLYVSATFYCGFDTVLKGKAIEHSKNVGNSTFDTECEMYECLGKTLKMFEDGKVTEDGLLTVVGALTEFDAKTLDHAKKEYSKCLPQVNQQISNFPKCTKFKIAMALLEECVKQSTSNGFSQTNFLN